MQLRQVQRGVVVGGAAPGVGVVVALMARASCSEGALLLRARVVPPPDGEDGEQLHSAGDALQSPPSARAAFQTLQGCKGSSATSA